MSKRKYYEMIITKQEDPDVINFNINGNIEMQGIANLKKLLFINSFDIKKDIEVDFSNVGYIDASAIGVFISLKKMQIQNSKTLKLKNLNNIIFNILKLSSLSESIGLKH
jgi:anti-anti-sigma factor